MRTTKESPTKKAARLKREADQTQKDQDIDDILPSWQVVSDSFDNISSLPEAKNMMKKLARVVYWLAKNKKE